MAPSIRGPRAPVTAGKLPGSLSRRWRASQANAVASRKSGSMPYSALLRSWRGANSPARRRIRPELCTPPPQATTSSAAGAYRAAADATLRAVSSSSVACTSAGFRLAAGERAVAIERLAPMTLAPRIEQAVGRPGIEAAHPTVGGQHGKVGDPTEVEYRSRLAGHAQQPGVQRGQQGCALSAGGDVGAAKIRHHVDAATFGDHAGVAQLQGERVGAAGSMAQSLAVRADGAYRRGRRAALRKQMQGGIGKRVTDLDIQPAPRVQVQRSLLLRQRQDARAQSLGPRVNMTGECVRQAVAEADQHRVDAVGAGTGDQPEVKRRGVVGHAGWLLSCRGWRGRSLGPA